MLIEKENMFWKRHKSVLLILAGLLVLDSVIWYLILFPKRASDNLELYFLDVGQGDSQLVRLPTGVDVLIDGGPPNSRVLSELSEILPASDSYIDLIIMSHPQLDHFGGLIDVLKKYEVGAFIGTGRKGEIDAYRELVEELKNREVPYIVLREGDRIRNGDNLFSVLSPNNQNLLSKELNDTSLVLTLESGELRALYTGDIGISLENYLAREYDLRAQILKVPHHGSKFSSGVEFVGEVKPQVAVVGVGKNSYGHPTEQALNRLAAVQALVFRTDQNGTVKVVLSSKNLHISAQK